MTRKATHIRTLATGVFDLNDPKPSENPSKQLQVARAMMVKYGKVKPANRANHLTKGKFYHLRLIFD